MLDSKIKSLAVANLQEIWNASPGTIFVANLQKVDQDGKLFSGQIYLQLIHIRDTYGLKVTRSTFDPIKPSEKFFLSRHTLEHEELRAFATGKLYEWQRELHEALRWAIATGNQPLTHTASRREEPRLKLVASNDRKAAKLSLEFITNRIKPGDAAVYSSGKINGGRFTLKKENLGKGEILTLTSCEGLPELGDFLNRTTTKAEVLSGKTEDPFTLWLHINLPLAGNFKWKAK